MSVSVDIIVVEENELTDEQRQEMLQLQMWCFSDVTAKEVEEDFCRPPIASVLAYSQNVLVACAEVFKREVEYEGQPITVGGFGPCTREDSRGQGIGTKVCETAMDYLKEQGGDIAFLSVDTGTETYRFYERLGFKMLARPFIYANIRGELKESNGGMIAPLCSKELFEHVLQGDAQFALTPEPGYW